MNTTAPGAQPRIGVFSTPLLETLEPRIAPAILVNPTTVIYQDVDGDMVTVKFSKAVLDSDQAFLDTVFGKGFVDGIDDDPQQLETLDLTDPVFAGVSLKITAKAGPIGDGFVNVGEILALGNDLGKVDLKGDLGRIEVGDASTLGLKFLKVESLGRFGTSTGAADLVSSLEGGVGKFVVSGDVFEARVLVSNGSVGSIQIGGSLIGGAAAASGEFLASDGDIGKVAIGGSLQGGAGNYSGQVRAFGDIGKVSIGGSLQGGNGDHSGQVNASGTIGKISIGGSLQGGDGMESGNIRAGGDISQVAISGSLQGGDGIMSGYIRAGGNIGKVSIGENLLGADGGLSGVIHAVENIGKIAIGGSLIGGDGTTSGLVRAEGAIGKVAISGSLLGGDGGASGVIYGIEGTGKVSIGGDLQGGSGNYSGAILSSRDIGKVSIGGDIQGGSGELSGAVNTFIAGGNLLQLAVKGSVFSGSGEGSGAIRIDGAIGKIHVAGSIMGDPDNPVHITSGVGGNALSIGVLSIGGSVENTLVLAGYGSHLAPNPLVGDAGIGKVTVGGNWIASSLVAGVENSDYPNFGDANDSVIAGGDPDILSRIASITVKGYVMGTVGGADHFGFVAEEIGKVRIGGNKGFVPAPGFTPLGATSDFNIHVL